MLPPTAPFAAALLLSGALAYQGHDYHPRQHRRVSNGTTKPVFDVSSEFSVKQVRNPHYKKKPGLMAMLDVYAKYSVPLTPELKTAVRISGLTSNHKRQVTGTTTASPPPDYDYEFFCPVDIGTPAQTMQLNFDTGSSDLWLFTTDTNPDDVGGQGVFNVSASNSISLKSGYNFSIAYGDGNTASGIVYEDVVSIGGASVTMAVESAINVSTAFTLDPYAWGLLGLGMSSGNTVSPVKQTTFTDSIKSALAAPLFAANLVHSTAGEYDFGFIDDSKHTGQIQYGSIEPQSIYWEFAATGYRIGDGVNGTDPNDGYVTYAWRTLADTGTTLLLLPDHIVDAYYGNVSGSAYDANQGGMVFPCSEADTAIPDFTFGIGLYKGVVPGPYLNYGNINSTTCYGGIQSQGDLEFGIFGDVLLKAQYAVFNLGERKVGMSNKALTT